MPSAAKMIDFASRRICLVLATAGWGKTTAVESWGDAHRCVWLRYEGRHDAAWILNGLARAVEPDVLVPATDVPTDPGLPDRLAATAADVCEQLHKALSQEVVLVVDDVS